MRAKTVFTLKMSACSLYSVQIFTEPLLVVTMQHRMETELLALTEMQQLNNTDPRKIIYQ